MSILKNKGLIITTFILPSFCLAGEYQQQIDFQHYTGNYHSSNYDINLSNSSIHFLQAYSPVNTDNGPLNEAIFLEKASGFFVTAAHSKDETQGKGIYSGYHSRSHENTMRLGSQWIDQNNIIYHAAYGQPMSNEEGTQYFLQAGIGYYINDTTAIDIYASRDRNKASSINAIDDDYGVSLKMLRSFSNDYTLSFEPRLLTGEGFDWVFFPVTFYINHHTGFSMEFSRRNSERDDSDSIDLSFHHYLTETFALQGAIITSDYSSGSDAEFISLGISLRM